jgi:hypothetical protein
MDPKASTTYRGLPPALRTPSFGVPASPHRYAAGSSLHAHEDPLILEIGSRILRAGFTNEGAPRCQMAWSDTMWRRAGDRIPTVTVGKRQNGRSVWDLGFALHGEEGEDLDTRLQRQLGLIKDLVERGLRVAYNRYHPTFRPARLLVGKS